jgi:hypothetical protein
MPWTPLRLRVRCRQTCRAATSRWSRRATRRMATCPPTRRWCWPRRRAPTRGRLPDCWCRSWRQSPGSRPWRFAGPGFINLRLGAEVWREELRRIAEQGAAYGKSERRPGRAGQCRICLGQSDGPDAHGSLPGRGGGRCACKAARGSRLRGYARILRQRCRQPGRYARPLRAPPLPGSAGRGRSARSRGPVSGRLSEARGALLAAEFGRGYGGQPEADWLPCSSRRRLRR